MYGGNLKSRNTKYICAGDYFCSGNLCELCPHGHYTHGACVKIQGLVTVGVNGMGSGLIPIVAYNYGAKKPERIYQSCQWAMFYSVMLYNVFFLVMEIVPEQVLLITAVSWLGELSLIWWAFVLAEALVIPAGMILWKKESGKSLKSLTVMCSE